MVEVLDLGGSRIYNEYHKYEGSIRYYDYVDGRWVHRVGSGDLVIEFRVLGTAGEYRECWWFYNTPLYRVYYNGDIVLW